MAADIQAGEKTTLIGLDVLSWRCEALEAAGWPVPLAIELAANPEIDLHIACDLLLKGADVETALRILL